MLWGGNRVEYECRDDRNSQKYSGGGGRFEKISFVPTRLARLDSTYNLF